MDIIEIARESGMLVLLEARIGREEYHSISGSLAALQRFAKAVQDHGGDSDAQSSASHA